MVSIQPHSQALQIHVLAAYFTIELSKDRSGMQSRKQSGKWPGYKFSLSLSRPFLGLHDQLHHSYSISIVATLAYCLQLQS